MFSLGPKQEVVANSVTDHCAKSISRPGRLTAALNYYRAKLGAGGGAWAALTQQAKITSPTTLLCGHEDPALGRHAADATAARVKGPYEIGVLSGTEHWLQFERPKT